MLAGFLSSLATANDIVTVYYHCPEPVLFLVLFKICCIALTLLYRLAMVISLSFINESLLGNYEYM